MDLDAKICYCFHVSRRKIVNYLRTSKPKVASQISECGGAGTGCGWCVPYLKQLFEEQRSGGAARIDVISVEDYERGRQGHIAAGRGSPPSDGPSQLPAPGAD